MALTFLLYRPVVTALRKSGLIDESHDFKAQKAGRRAGIMLGSTFMIATCIFGILILRGVI